MLEIVDKCKKVCYHNAQIEHEQALYEDCRRWTDRPTEGVKLSGDRKIEYCNRIGTPENPVKRSGAEGAKRRRR